MKNPFKLIHVLSICLTLIIVSCSSDDSNDNTNDNSAEIQQIENEAQSGAWRITSYVDDGNDETNDFNSYDFTFNSDGTLVADNGATTYNGTWSVTDSGSSDDSNDDIDFNIQFSVPDTHDFYDLNDDWDIVTHNSNRIDLIDISGGNGGTDTLTFEKN